MGFMKWISHIIWHLVTLVTIPLFFLGAAFGLLGTALYYSGPFIEILLSTNGINSFFTDPMARNILNECFNGNAQLRNPLQLNNGTYMPIFDKFVLESYHIEQVALQFQTTRDSPTQQRLNKMYSDAISNVALIQGTTNVAPNIVLNELSSYTNYRLNNTKIESCSKRTEDFWVSSQNSCPGDYPFTTSSSQTSRLGEKACLNVREWSSANVGTRYANEPSCSNLNIVQTVQNYVTAINNYATDAEPLINEIRTDLTE